jgi:hypothetical protein
LEEVEAEEVTAKDSDMAASKTDTTEEEENKWEKLLRTRYILDLSLESMHVVHRCAVLEISLPKGGCTINQACINCDVLPTGGRSCRLRMKQHLEGASACGKLCLTMSPFC